MKEAPIRVGLVGFGLAGRVFHAPFIRAVPALQLVSILQRSGLACEGYPNVHICRSLAEMLASDVQCVVIATPNATHVELAREALLAGKHVVVDKPLAPSSREALELEQLAGQRGLVLAPFHNRRWDGDFLTLQELLRSGRLGRLVSFESRFDRFRPAVRVGSWREDADLANGLLMDLGPHLLDQALALWGKPVAVRASIRSERSQAEGIEDAFEIDLTFESGGFQMGARLAASMLSAIPGPRFLLHGTGGSYRKEGLDPQEPRVKAGAQIPVLGQSGDWGLEDPSSWGQAVLATEAGLHPDTVPTLAGDYRQFYAHVAAAIRGEQPLAVTARDAVHVAQIIELARQSSRQGRTLKMDALAYY